MLERMSPTAKQRAFRGIRVAIRGASRAMHGCEGRDAG
jgi:hypothetical protein